MDKLEFKSKNCWEVYSSQKDQAEIEKISTRYLDFLTRCKTERETIAYVGDRLREAGFDAGFTAGSAKGMQSMQGKALFAARKGSGKLSDGLQIIFAHTDAPRLDLKQRPCRSKVEWPRPKPTITAESANTNGSRDLWPCTGW